MYQNNITTLKDVVKERAIIRNVSLHRNSDGSLDIAGNLAIWENVMNRFEKIKLWEDKTPNFDDRDNRQSEPFIVFIPAMDNGHKKDTILVAHGGGFKIRTGCEGINVANFFHNEGFNVAILSYRLEPYDRFDAIADMQRSIRLLRAKQEILDISNKVFIMGFSAGGMLSANCATHFDDGNKDSTDLIEQQSCRPDAAVIGYGAMSVASFPLPFGSEPDLKMWGENYEQRVYLAPEKNIKLNTPPFFIWQTLSDDGRHGMCLAKALQDVGIPYELHIFQAGEHGLAMADGENDLASNIPHVARWGKLCSEWLNEL